MLKVCCKCTLPCSLAQLLVLSVAVHNKKTASFALNIWKSRIKSGQYSDFFFLKILGSPSELCTVIFEMRLRIFFFFQTTLFFSLLRRRQARLQKELAEAAKEPLPVEP